MVGVDGGVGPKKLGGEGVQKKLVKKRLQKNGGVFQSVPNLNVF